jgi:DNA-binding Lrp family transcriptional regulator
MQAIVRYFISSPNIIRWMPRSDRLDRIDRELVMALQHNGRASNKDLAERVGLAPSTCLERVRSLVRRGVLTGFRAEVDPVALGRGVQAIVGVRLRTHSRAEVDAFRDYALSLPETIAVTHVGGADDFLVHVGVADTQHLRDFALDRLTARPEVAHLETRIVFEHVRKPALEALAPRAG